MEAEAVVGQLDVSGDDDDFDDASCSTKQPCLPAADWPMSRGEKVGRVIKLYDMDMQVSSQLLQEKEEEAEALRKEMLFGVAEPVALNSRRASSCGFASVPAALDSYTEVQRVRRLSDASTAASACSTHLASSVVAEEAAARLRQAVQDAAVVLAELSHPPAGPAAEVPLSRCRARSTGTLITASALDYPSAMPAALPCAIEDAFGAGRRRPRGSSETFANNASFASQRQRRHGGSLQRQLMRSNSATSVPTYQAFQDNAVGCDSDDSAREADCETPLPARSVSGSRIVARDSNHCGPRRRRISRGAGSQGPSAEEHAACRTVADQPQPQPPQHSMNERGRSMGRQEAASNGRGRFGRFLQSVESFLQKPSSDGQVVSRSLPPQRPPQTLPPTPRVPLMSLEAFLG